MQGSGADGIGPVDVGPALDQQLHRIRAIVVGSVEQCGLALRVWNVDQAGVPIEDGREPHRRGLEQIDLGTVVEQQWRDFVRRFELHGPP